MIINRLIINRVRPRQAGRPAARPRQLGEGKGVKRKKKLAQLGAWPTNCSGPVGRRSDNASSRPTPRSIKKSQTSPY